ncbi:hypothetical protein YC2023_008117 [Brassica napus]
MRLPLAETSSCLILRIFLFTDLFYFLLSFLHIYNQLPISFLHISYNWFFNQLLLTLRRRETKSILVKPWKEEEKEKSWKKE